MCGLTVVEVNIHMVGICYREPILMFEMASDTALPLLEFQSLPSGPLKGA